MKPSFKLPSLAKTHPLYPWTLLLNILFATFLSVYSAVSTMISDDAIQGELAMSQTQTVWITTLYLLGINTTVPIAGLLSNHFGYKRMYTLGLILFTFGGGLIGFSNHFETLAPIRFLQGIGAGFIFPLGLALITQIFPKEKLNIALSLYVGSFGGGVGFGLPLSGYLTQFHSWRLLFISIIPLGIALILSFLATDRSKEKHDTNPIDIWGFIFLVSLIASLLIGLTFGPLPATDAGWRSPFILSCFSFSAVALIAFLWIESRHPYPLMPLHLFKDPLFTITVPTMFLLGMSIFASVSVSVDYMLFALFYEKFVTGKIGMVYGFTFAAFSLVANFLLNMKIPIPALTFTGLLILIFSYFFNDRLDWQSGPHQIIPILFIRGIGLGLSLGPLTIQGLSNLAPDLRPIGATFLTFFRQVGATYGSTIIATITIKRTIFHAARFGEQSNTQLPEYRRTFRKIFTQYFTEKSDKGFESAVQAKARIISNIKTQAFIQGQSDALIIFGYIAIVMASLLALLMIYQWAKNRKTPTIDTNEK